MNASLRQMFLHDFSLVTNTNKLMYQNFNVNVAFKETKNKENGLYAK